MYQFIIKRHVAKACPDAELISYKNGVEAIEGFKTLITGAALFDVILLDINMPIMDGWQFLSVLEEAFPEIGKKVDIYVVSTSLDIRDKERALADKNVKEYISKPIPTEKLLQILSGSN
jgi:CheY-like chemotaxis protein